MEKEKKAASGTQVKFGTFGGVFTPSVLTIIGVILFLRTGWMVGETGIAGALLIIIIAHSVTVATGLSLSSISTNIRIGAGGAYSVIAKSLGPEVGGAIGIPLYASQAISTAFYIAGFTEAWLSFEQSYGLPVHERLHVALATWAILSFISYVGADWAIRVQYVIMAAVALAIVSFFGGTPMEGAGVAAWRVSGYKNFFEVFAIFFPAVTGILAGASMSGDLKDAKKSIPVGTMSAIAVGFIVYASAAVWYGLAADSASLRDNSAVMIDISRFGWTFYAGVFAATLSSALGTLVGAPRTLNALGIHGIIPWSGFFARRDKKGQPRNAGVLTYAFSLVFVVFGSLDTIAPLLTMFFLVTYGMVNLVTFIEQSIGIVSFRPTFRSPRFVSLYGAAACFFIMIVIDPIIGTLALTIISGIYVYLLHSGLKARWGDVRSGLFSSIAMWSARQSLQLPRHTKSWIPNLLLPVEDPKASPLFFRLARDITCPGGSVTAFTVASTLEKPRKEKQLVEALEPLKKDKIFCVSSTIEGEEFLISSLTLVQFLKNIFLRPNILFITVSDHPEKDGPILEMLRAGTEQEMGLAILKLHPKAALNQQKEINLVLRDKSPNKHLAILLAIQLHKNWEHSKINLVTMVSDEDEYREQADFFHQVKEAARMPAGTTVNVIQGKFPEDLDMFPRCDIAICGLGDEISLDFVRRISEYSQVSCLFVRDSGEESAFV